MSSELGLLTTEMLALSERGDNAPVDMLVGDIYGQDYGKIGLKSSTIASSFGKVFRKGADPERKKTFRQEDISRSLLYAISNNIGQIAYMNAEKHGLDRIYFGGCFIRGKVFILYRADEKVMLRPSRRCRTLSVSGAKARCEPCSFDTKDSLVQLAHG